MRSLVNILFGSSFPIFLLPINVVKFSTLDENKEDQSTLTLSKFSNYRAF